MKLIVGLGNPGAEYERTRHNLGFELVDELARRGGIAVKRRVDQALVGTGTVAGIASILAKPQTYMNASGDSVKALATRHGIDVTSDLIVGVDDLALPFGRIRVRPGGSAGGHNGLKSLIARLGTERFTRVRMGIAPDHELTDARRYVLSPFARSAQEAVAAMVARAADAVEAVMTDGVERTMARFNSEPVV